MYKICARCLFRVEMGKSTCTTCGARNDYLTQTAAEALEMQEVRRVHNLYLRILSWDKSHPVALSCAKLLSESQGKALQFVEEARLSVMSKLSHHG